MTTAAQADDYTLKAELSYLDRLTVWPQFAFGDEGIDGLVPSCKVESWRELERVVAGPPHSSNVGQMIYRGHRRYDWPLAPGLSRAFDGGAIPGEWAAGILHKFKLSMRGRGSDISGYDDNEVWAIGQHFGLFTPLLDWTESAFVALFFAFADADRVEEKDNPTRTVFCLNRSALDDVLDDFFFEPKFGENTRLVNQAGLFTVTSSEAENPVTEIINALGDTGAIDLDNPDAEQLAKFICKIHIPNVDRVSCLSMLRKMNIHHASLFPDPTGASSYCNDWLSRAVAERKELEKALAVARATAAVAENKPFEMPTDEAGADAVLEDVLQQLASLEGTGLFDLSTIARRVHDLYTSRSGLDWWAHPTTRARMKVDLKRLLASMDWPESSREVLAERLTELYANRDSKVDR
ncbi:FRG domain-containing protein [Devosia sp. Root105]|uniref:FRG domain-containing protein n=1 Tax=Devosia sp. Root105 TaxID=1736423 RepID=UPI0007020DB3|nr:FRG domain-containing protein [Devosia sp. Root105]KQU95246.1 hypothetical protein ASC68_19030 [Devosia sp. Root105]